MSDVEELAIYLVYIVEEPSVKISYIMFIFDTTYIKK
jgi:hypothetical protein